jgi:hypothetical protein
MKYNDIVNENLGHDASRMEQDHEVQMARSDCYFAAKNAIALHQMLKGISEEQGLDGWVSEKITIAADYLKTVREYLEYEKVSGVDSIEVVATEDAGMGGASAGGTGSASVAVSMAAPKKSKMIKR